MQFVLMSRPAEDVIRHDQFDAVGVSPLCTALFWVGTLIGRVLGRYLVVSDAHIGPMKGAASVVGNIVQTGDDADWAGCHRVGSHLAQRHQHWQTLSGGART